MSCCCTGACRVPPYMCPSFSPTQPAPQLPPQPQIWNWAVQVGCICPPGANKDCERLDCPRKSALPGA